MFRKDKSVKLSLKHLNDIYYILFTEDEILLQEKLKNYILSEDIYSDLEIKEAKEKYDIQRNEAIRNKSIEGKNLESEW